MPVSRIATNVVSASLDVRRFDHIFWVPDCGNITTAGSTKAPDDDCKTPGKDDDSQLRWSTIAVKAKTTIAATELRQFCRSNSRLSLYGKGRPPQPEPTVVLEVGVWR